MSTGAKLKLESGALDGKYVGFKAPDSSFESDAIWELPAVDGAAGQTLVTNGSKVLGWGTSVESGTYTPTVITSDNVSNNNVYLAKYMRIGNVVMVSGVVDVIPSSIAATTLTLSLPIASNLSFIFHLSGTVVRPHNVGLPYNAGIVFADTPNHGAGLSVVVSNTNNASWAYQFMYSVE